MIAATKRPDWEFRLEFHVGSCVHRQFRYGYFDCCTFAADAILEMTGVDVMKKLRDYKGQKAAKQLLESLGGMERALETIAAENRMEEVTVLKAQRGDMVLIRGKRPAVGILSLDGSWVVVPSVRGIFRIPLMLCARAWRVG